MIYAWIRRTGSYTGRGLPDPSTHGVVQALIRRWPAPGYVAFRRELATIADKMRPFPIWQGQPLSPDDWACPIDDDDWHSPNIKILAEMPAEVDFVWWDIAAIRWVPPCHYRERWQHEGRVVPGTCGYAIRVRALPSRDSADYALLRDDHVFALTHAVRLWMNPRYVPIIGGLWNVTPASVSIACEFGGRLILPSTSDITEILASALPDWIRSGVELIANLLHKYKLCAKIQKE